jgi:hypothetical protein
MKSETLQENIQAMAEIVSGAADDEHLRKYRSELAQFSSETFLRAGTELQVLGHVGGSDSLHGVSPFGNGSDEAVAVSVLLRIAGRLVSSSADLFEDGRRYAAAALLRQMVEIEYLAWTMETRDREGERWLRSKWKQRRDFFTPQKLREAAGEGKFRGVDFSFHCEHGGHPVPGASELLDDDGHGDQVLLADLLGHAGRIWDHLLGWARKSSHGAPILSRGRRISDRFAAWKSKDPLAKLPPPPEPALKGHLRRDS